MALPPNVVFVCMLLVQALVSNAGPAGVCWKLVERGELTLFLSPEVIEEFTDVVRRPKLVRRLSSLTSDRVDAFVKELSNRPQIVMSVPSVFSYSRDPNDEKYVNLAVAVGAQYLVSRDKDLLDLMHDEAFTKRFPTLQILDPVALLHLLIPQKP